ncbi:MAG TPA: FecR domain-containing protein, partial [Niastella sp.]|nr:FecR domain-containing protein [Niastella sp.]
MPRYETLTGSLPMDHIAFRELLLRYASGTASPNEKVLVEHWYELLYNNSLPALKQEELNTIEQEMWTYIEQEGILPGNGPVVASIESNRRPRLLYYISAAAIVIALAITCCFLFEPKPIAFSYEQSRRQHQLSETINSTSAPQGVLLSDGSYVILQPSSKIAFSNFNSASREVYLEGAAFFQVTKDPKRPFYVYTNELVTKVLGTSFDVRAFSHDDTVKVVVHTGKVTVYQRRKNEGEQQLTKLSATIITPNQQVLFNRQQLSIIKSIFMQPQAVITSSDKSNSQLFFTDAPAPEVFMSIQRSYGISIFYDEEQISHCSFTAAFTNETFFERIKLVCKAIEATYEQADGQIIITGHVW